MPPVLRQRVGDQAGSGQKRTCTGNFNQPTLPGSLLVVTAVSSGGSAALTGPSGFTLIRERVVGDLKLAMWYLEGAPSTQSVSVTTSVDRPLQMQAMEYTGAAMANALDQVTIATNQTNLASTGTTNTTSQSDSIVVACVANQVASTLQSGFSGALAALIGQGTTTPQSGWGWLGLGSDPDNLRNRLSVHHAITSAVQQFVLQAYLSAIAPWIAILCVFKGGSSGPVRMTSRNRPAITTGGRGDLTVFGPLRSTQLVSGAQGFFISGGTARIGPFVHQYRLGGWDGLLIGDSTPYRVESVEGLGGWEMRTSDDELPRADGGIRGIDLQSARQILFKVNTHSELATGSPEAHADIQDKLDVLYRALVPQRSQDWELLWRDPDQPLKMIRCRPINIIQNLTADQLLLLNQTFALKATDPRHYSAFAKSVRIPNTPAGGIPFIQLVLNEGNGFAFPVIRVTPTDVPLTRIELRNETYDLSWAIEGVIPVGSTVVGDMEAHQNIGPARSVITMDGQSKYGLWRQPRETFRIAPGANDLTLTTVPSGAQVTATVEFRDTWSG